MLLLAVRHIARAPRNDSPLHGKSSTFNPTRIAFQYTIRQEIMTSQDLDN